MLWLRDLVGRGYIRKRKDGIIEYILGDIESIQYLLSNLKPHLRLKRKQADLMLKVLKLKAGTKTAQDFLNLAKEIDKFQELNYSKKRIQNSFQVEKVLRKEGFLAP